MPNFHHHPDGLIFIRTDAGIYRETVENFEADLGGAYAGLPDGFSERMYEPDARHVLCDGAGAEPQPLKWGEGDGYIRSFDALMAAKDARENPPLTLDDERRRRISEVKRAGFDRVHAQFPPHEQRRLAFKAASDAERTACRDLIEAVKAAVDAAETAIRGQDDPAQMDIYLDNATTAIEAIQ